MARRRECSPPPFRSRATRRRATAAIEDGSDGSQFVRRVRKPMMQGGSNAMKHSLPSSILTVRTYATQYGPFSPGKFNSEEVI